MRWRYPLSDIDFGKEEEREVLKVLRSRWLSTGPVTERFEKAFSEYLGEGYSVAVSNGTGALHLALACLDLREGDEVILPSLTFVATANVVLYVGARPVFADVTGPGDLTLSPRQVEERITPRTKAILVMHYGGYPCDMKRIVNLAKQKSLYVIEDACHAPGARYRGQRCGLIGDLGCFSFFANKNLVAGEGGMVVTRNKDLAGKVRALRSHGMEALSWDKYRGHLSAYDIKKLGYNYRITEIQSALGLAQLKKLDRSNEIRKKLATVYREELQEVGGISIPFSGTVGEPSFHLAPILVDTGSNRDRLMRELRDLRVQTSIHYPPIHLFSLYRERFGYKNGMLPETEKISKKELTLPLHPRMKIGDVKWIANQIKKIMKKE